MFCSAPNSHRLGSSCAKLMQKLLPRTSNNSYSPHARRLLFAPQNELLPGTKWTLPSFTQKQGSISIHIVREEMRRWVRDILISLLVPRVNWNFPFFQLFNFLTLEICFSLTWTLSQVEKSQGEIYRLRAKLENTQSENENIQVRSADPKLNKN